MQLLKILDKIKFIILLSIFLLSVIFIAFFFVGNKKTEELNNDLMEVHDRPSSVTDTSLIYLGEEKDESETEHYSILDNMMPLLERNPDTVGWVKIDTLIDNVVVQGDDNEYYLTRNFDKEYSESGTIFLDQYCSINPRFGCNNIILYGHNQMNGSMFGSLTTYKKDPLYVNKAPYIDFSNNYNNYKFKIVSFFITNTIEEQDDEPVFRYWNFSRFNNKYPFELFKNEITRRSLVTSNVDISEKDTFITLSTCAVDFNGARFVVIGRAIRDEKDLNTEPFYELNEDAYLPDIYYELDCDSFVY